MNDLLRAEQQWDNTPPHVRNIQSDGLQIRTIDNRFVQSSLAYLPAFDLDTMRQVIWNKKP